MTPDQLRRALVETARRAYAEKLFSGTSGNLSVRNGETMLITPTSVRYEELTPEDVVQMDLDGKVLAGTPSSEWRLHAELYKNRPDVLAIVHTHSPYAAAFAAASFSSLLSMPLRKQVNISDTVFCISSSSNMLTILAGETSPF